MLAVEIWIHCGVLVVENLIGGVALVVEIKKCCVGKTLFDCQVKTENVIKQNKIGNIVRYSYSLQYQQM